MKRSTGLSPDDLGLETNVTKIDNRTDETQVDIEVGEPAGIRPALEALLNRHNAENGSNTPDFVLADYLTACLAAYDEAIRARAKWYSRIDVPGKGSVPFVGLETT